MKTFGRTLLTMIALCGALSVGTTASAQQQDPSAVTWTMTVFASDRGLTSESFNVKDLESCTKMAKVLVLGVGNLSMDVLCTSNEGDVATFKHK